MRVLGLVLRQTRYNLLAFTRNPASAFFTIVFPVMFLVIFNVLFGNGKTVVQGQVVSQAAFYVPGITVFGVVSACYTNLAMVLTIERDNGILKRVRGTPLPPGAYLAARLLTSVLIAALLVAVCLAFGRIFYGVPLPRTWLAFAVTVVVGAAALCALGMAVAAVVPNQDAAPAVVNATMLPLLFISDVFIPVDRAPAWLRDLADLFPIRHFASALDTSFLPAATGSGFRTGDLLVLAGWGVAGLLFALRWFRWQPRT